MKNLIRILFLFVIVIIPSNLYSTNSKYELRGVWIATIKNIDWPSEPGLTADVQKAELRSRKIQPGDEV